METALDLKAPMLSLSPEGAAAVSDSSDLTKSDVVETDRQAALRRVHGHFNDDEQKILELWEAAATYSELLNLNRKYLRGELPFTVYHGGAICDETKPLVTGLLRLHDYGILTVESQPSEDSGPEYLACAADCPCKKEPFWRQRKQRAFLTFLLPTRGARFALQVAEQFVNGLATDEHFYACVTFPGRRCRRGGCSPDDRSCSSFAENFETHLNTVAEQKEDLKATKAEPSQILDLNCACCLRYFHTTAAVMETVRPLVINVAAWSWTEEDLAGKVEAAALRAGLEKLYEDGAESGEDESEHESEEDAENSL